ncbi:MAG: trypsin [Alphaproteobacteria bacterium HGW-Alphaproteobacteria-2]|nr:MAG: trypsin [Alphaproteobacteria bacterium HGW-Alphaproteobacteria-2]
MRLIAILVMIMQIYVAMGPLTAQEAKHLERLTTADQSRGWESVGRIELAGSGFCTGTLVTERLVLTAAHCLFDRETGARHPLEAIEFRAGWRDGRAAAYRQARRAVIHPNYVFGGEDRIGATVHDMALIELDNPVRLPSLPPFGIAAAPKVGATVDLVSYAVDRAEAPSREERCHVLGEERGLLMLSCNVDFGASGAPVFLRRGETAEVVSLVSAKAEWRGQKVAIAVAVAPHMALMTDILEGRVSRARDVQITGSASVADQPGTADHPGAKFLRP